MVLPHTSSFTASLTPSFIVEEIFDETSTLDNVSADLLSPLSPPGNIAISDDEDGSLPWNPTRKRRTVCGEVRGWMCGVVRGEVRGWTCGVVRGGCVVW